MFADKGFEARLDSQAGENEDKPTAIVDLSPERHAGVVYMFNGKSEGALFAYRFGKCFPTEQMDDTARVLVQHLNERHAYKGGYWKCAWVNPVKSKWDKNSRLFRTYYPSEMAIAYYDKDDDCQFTVNIDESIDVILDTGFRHWIDQCVQAYEEVERMKAYVGIEEGKDTYCRAKGEQPKGHMLQ